jgi:hypothetical protein
MDEWGTTGNGFDGETYLANQEKRQEIQQVAQLASVLRNKRLVDRDLCRACGQNGGVKGMAKQLDIEELEVISPSGYQLISLK